MKILLCDDDISVIRVLKSQINWEKLGIDVLLEAYSGEAARELIAKERPELVLCDIEMPRESGIEVLKFVHEQGISCAFAFLTSYESFAYAREAVRFGAVNYLTKPIDLAEVEAALAGMAADMRARQAQQEEIQADKGGREAKINHILEELYDGVYGEELPRVQAMLDQQRMKTAADSLWRMVCVCTQSGDGRAEEGELRLEPGLERYSLRNLAQEIIADRLDLAYTVSDVGERFSYLLLFVEEERFGEEQLLSSCRRFIRLCSSYLHVSPLCVISEPFPLYRTALAGPAVRRMAKRLRMNEGKVFLYREAAAADSPKTQEKGYDLPDELAIRGFLKNKDKGAYLGAVAKCTGEIAGGGFVSEGQLSTLHHDLLQAFFGALRDNRVPAHALMEEETMRELEENAERSLLDLVRFAAGLFDRAVAVLQEDPAAGSMAGQVKRYIAEHYREDIDREEIAEAIFITPNYLSRLIRQELGTNLRDYINSLRVEEAKRLMASTDKPITEIAGEVGFDNISYFSTVFKRIVGVSPAEWRSKKE